MTYKQRELIRTQTRDIAKKLDEMELEVWLEEMRYEREILAIKCGTICEVIRERENIYHIEEMDN